MPSGILWPFPANADFYGSVSVDHYALEIFCGAWKRLSYLMSPASRHRSVVNFGIRGCRSRRGANRTPGVMGKGCQIGAVCPHLGDDLIGKKRRVSTIFCINTQANCAGLNANESKETGGKNQYGNQCFQNNHTTLVMGGDDGLDRSDYGVHVRDTF